jgi:6,7-dimethyl-8-ribityllumazine synthase
LGVRDGLAVGNGIQTVEDEAQSGLGAVSDRSEKDKGGGAAKAALGAFGLCATSGTFDGSK